MLMDFGEWSPQFESPIFLAPGSYVIGQVELGKESSVWFNAVIRADTERIRLGQRSNLQDNSTLHADYGFPCLIGNDVTIGHNAVVHGALLEDRVLVGMGSVIMNGAHIQSDVVVAAGTLIPEEVEIPSGSLVLGRPGRVVRGLTSQEIEHILWVSQHYVNQWVERGWHFQ
jgi:carbonic anhydrase/acetyltransferase-like protein (isoleucine patch superfamily)